MNISSTPMFHGKTPGRGFLPKAGFSQSRRGFALVVTLTLMILLTLLAVGLLGLSTITLRGSTQAMAHNEARANARLALMLAVGELQKQLGSDQRISARAEILDDDPATGEVDDVANPHYLGVWDSWNTWLTDNKGTLTIQDTYQRGRHPSLFRSWLVSHPEAGNYDTAISMTPAADAVVLCGDGSAGLDDTNHVKASRIQVRSGTRVTGSYAWWVDDESQKARLDLKPRGGGGTVEKAQVLASHTGRAGIEKMDGMAGFDTTPDSLKKMITIGQAGISAAAASQHFHNLTAYSLGLHTDVRWGGFKSDLNLAFESENLPAQMDEATLFSGRPFDAPIRPLTGKLANTTPQNPYVAPMSWRQLREYYRLYRGFSDSGTKQPVEWNGVKPFTRRYNMRGDQPNEWDAGGYTRQLVLLRQSWIFATASETPTNPASAAGGIAYYILAIPVSWWWNPYNITMKVDPKEISTFGSVLPVTGIEAKLYNDGTLLRKYDFPGDDWRVRPNGNLQGFKGDNSAAIAGQGGNRMVIDVSPTSGASASLDFEPGQVRVFSVDNTVTGRDFAATPGYTEIANTPGGAERGMKFRVYPVVLSSTGPPVVASPLGELSISLRLSDDYGGPNVARFAGVTSRAGFLWHNQEVTGHSGILADGSKVTYSMEKEDSGFPVLRMGATSIEWFKTGEMADAWIVDDAGSSRARWDPAIGSQPLPIGIYSIVAKSADRLVYDSSADYTKDFRNRSWLHAPPTRLSNLLINPEDLNRADSPYQVHFRPISSVGPELQTSGDNGYFGGGYISGKGGQTHLSMLSLPTAPVMNLGSLAGVRIDHARARITQRNDTFSNPTVASDKLSLQYDYENYKHLAHAGGAFGVGIGNGYAHPMIDPDKVYTRNNFGADIGFDKARFPNHASTKLPVCDDYWDHLFLANEELWDSWFCSGLAPEVAQGSVTKSKREVANEFFGGMTTLLPPYYQPDLRDKTPADLADLVETTTAAPGGNGWERIGSHILNRGQFNVNSTSKEAWKALLMSLADRSLAYNGTGDPSVIAGDPNEASLSRYQLTNSSTAAAGPSDAHAWRGIRKLTEIQIDKLAEEIVRQVKLRGPFLNMAEFVNRRLTNGATGVTGTLQAAIDWDEFNDDYTGGTQGSGESINKDYKVGTAMISNSDLPATYPNPKAATGSRYAGIPGYVMQSDLLQGIASSLSVRGDTFVVRTYGESLAADGTVAAQAWCEAVVQRMPEYCDPADVADKKLRFPDQLPTSASILNPFNAKFGRKFEITAFRWLNENEI